MPTNELVLFESQDKSISLNVPLKNDSVWLNRNQMAELFDRDVKTIGKHVNNAIREELAGLPVVAKFATTAADGKTYMVDYYDLDVIISVGYRVKSQRGVEFRKWANTVLRQYIMEGYAVNHNRILELGEVIRIMKRTQKSLDAQQVLAVIERYSTALDLLDDYDHQTMRRPKGSEATYVLTYEECRSVIDSMRFGNESALFGNEKDDSFKGSIQNMKIEHITGGELLQIGEHLLACHAAVPRENAVGAFAAHREGAAQQMPDSPFQRIIFRSVVDRQLDADFGNFHITHDAVSGNIELAVIVGRCCQ